MPLGGTWGSGAGGCPQLPTGPQTPNQEGGFVCKQKGVCCSRRGSSWDWCGEGNVPVHRGRAGTGCPHSRLGKGESDLRPAFLQGQQRAFCTWVKYRPISIKAPACFYKYLSQFSGVLMWLWCLPRLQGPVAMATRPRDQPLFIHGKLPHPGLGVGWYRGLEGGPSRGRMDEQRIKIVSSLEGTWQDSGFTARVLAQNYWSLSCMSGRDILFVQL